MNNLTSPTASVEGADVGILRVRDAAEVTWSDGADVVVVGFGGAGAATGIQAREFGATVLAIDRFEGGGATAYSGGVVYAGATRYLRDSGFEDTPKEMFKYLEAEGSVVDTETLRRFCEGSNGDIEWLDKHGVPHAGRAFLEKTQFPPDPYYLYYTGNETMPAYAAIAKPAPRGHRTVAHGLGGHVYYAKLKQAALNLGVRLSPHTPATRLVVDQSGAVVGVEVNALPTELHKIRRRLYNAVNPHLPFNNGRAEKAIMAARCMEREHRNLRLLRAFGGVVLAAGGFIYNLQMLGEHRPLLAKNFKMLLRIGCMGDDGSGISLGLAAGAATRLMENVFTGRVVSPPYIFPHQIIVNRDGKRFVNEAAYSNIVGTGIVAQPGGGKAWLIIDATSFWAAIKQCLFPGSGMFRDWGAPALFNIVMGGTRRGRNLSVLAKKVGIDPVGLQKSVNEYNATVETGIPDPFGKAKEMMHRIAADTPHYAVNTSLDNPFWPTAALTMGGLDVDETTGMVRRGDGTCINGLYAAGRTAVGVCSGGYVSGMSIADTVFSGRRAARAATSAARNRDDQGSV